MRLRRAVATSQADLPRRFQRQAFPESFQCVHGVRKHVQVRALVRRSSEMPTVATRAPPTLQRTRKDLDPNLSSIDV